MTVPARRLVVAVAVALAEAAHLPAASASASSDELARAAAAHEAAGRDDLAVRRYTEALELDRATRAAWLGLARLRARRGDLREAERVATAALSHLPGDVDLLLERGTARRLLGERGAAEQDFAEASARDPDVLERLADRYVAESKMPAALATWRRRLAELEQRGDLSGSGEAQAQARARAHTMVAALAVLVAEADPVSAPPGPRPNGVRLTLARTLRRPPPGPAR